VVDVDGNSLSIELVDEVANTDGSNVGLDVVGEREDVVGKFDIADVSLREHLVEQGVAGLAIWAQQIIKCFNVKLGRVFAYVNPVVEVRDGHVLGTQSKGNKESEHCNLSSHY
jgi:hypothetical protein